MRYRTRLRRIVYSTVSVAMLLLAQSIGVSGQAQPTKRFLTGPLTIEDQGSFFIGGVPKITQDAVRPASGPVHHATGAAIHGPAPHQITIGQMYVQVQIPPKRADRAGRSSWFMDHHTPAACLESTPDGREGWYPYFVRKGVSTYVVDQAGRGRSGFDDSVLHEAKSGIESGDATAHGSSSPASEGLPTTAHGPAGSVTRCHRTRRFSPERSIPHGDQRSRIRIPTSFRHVAPLFPIEAVDPNMRLAGRRPWAGAGGSAFALRPEYTSNWFRTRRSRCRVPFAAHAIRRSCRPPIRGRRGTWPCSSSGSGGAIVATHSQSGIMGHHMARILKERGHLDLLRD